MTAENEVERYRSVNRAHSVSYWLEPLHRADHVRALVAAFGDGQSRYPGEFSYSPRRIAPRIEALKSFAASLDPSTSPARALVLDELRSSIEFAQALLAGDDESYRTAQIAAHGLPGASVLAHARRQLAVASGPQEYQAVVSAEELSVRIHDVLQGLAISGWDVVLEPNMSARASVNGIRRRIRVRAGQDFTPKEADRLVVHEVGGHVLRWVNSERQPEAWASVPLGNTIATEEGLAVCREVEFGGTDQETMRTYAARCIAVDVASREGIMAVVAAIEPAVGLEQAAEIAFRVKRGLRDPNLPGGLTKDWGYLGGFLLADEIRRTKPYHYALLTAVKWPIDALATIHMLADEGSLVMPSLVPTARSLGLN